MSKKKSKGVSAITSGSIMFMIMLSVLSPLLFYVADIDNLYDDVLAERKESDVYRNIESISIGTSTAALRFSFPNGYRVYMVSLLSPFFVCVLSRGSL